MRRAMVLTTDSRAAPSIIRSLGKKGVYVIGGGEKRLAKGFYSKWCKEKFLYPNVAEKPILAKRYILNRLKEKEPDVFIATSEALLLVLSEIRDEIIQYTIPNFPKGDVLLSTFNKASVLKIAQNIGIQIPQTKFVEDLDDLKAIKKEIKYPAIIKPRFSAYYDGTKISSARRTVCFNQEDFTKKYLEIHSKVPFPLIQEIIPEQGRGGTGIFFLLSQESKPLAVFSHERLLETHPLGGSSVIAKSIKPNPQLLEKSGELLRELGVHGVAMVEFKKDPRDGVLKLMEINGRFWGSLPLAVASGVDFPYLLFQYLVGEKIEPVQDYRVGLVMRYLYRHFIRLHYISEGTPQYWKGPYPSFSSELVAFIKYFFNGTKYYYINDDPLPFFIDYMDYLQDNWRRLKGKFSESL